MFRLAGLGDDVSVLHSRQQLVVSMHKKCVIIFACMVEQ